MRIAVSGTHFTGKSTLVDDLHDALLNHRVITEPYYLLEDEGYEFSDPPSLEDFEHQLRRSLSLLKSRDSNIIFDRCPLDFLGYIAALDDAEAFDSDRWLPAITAAMATLNLIVFIPVEAPDRIPLPLGEDLAFRQNVNVKLQEIILDDSLGLDLTTIEATGTRTQRLTTVLRQLNHPYETEDKN
jgi:hypothetical protein